MFNLLLFSVLAVRFWQLDLKPVHHDESINGWFVTRLWETGSFQYDPTNYHGPLLFWLFQGAESIGGHGIAPFRAVTVLFSALTLLWIHRWARSRFGLSGWWTLGLAFSPGFLFFSRSAIHESALVFFVTVATTAWIDLWCLKRIRQAPLFLYGLTGALLLKETFVIPLALGILVTLPLAFRRRFWRELTAEADRIFLHFLICVLLWHLFYTGFWRYPQGTIDFFKAFLPWTKTGTEGAGHQKEAAYFLKLIWSNEAATLVALMMTALGVAFRGWVRGLCLWSLGILAAYSLIPYKTPWCLLSIQIPLWISAVVVLAKTPFLARLAGHGAFVAAGIATAGFWFSLNFEDPTRSHPYVYVQTAHDSKMFVESLMRQSDERPEIRTARIQWGGFEPWPFPWWLARFSQQTSLPVTRRLDTDADLVMVDLQDEQIAETGLQGGFWKARFVVRDAREPSVVYLRRSVFECPFARCVEVDL